MDALIIAAGFGSRLRPVAESKPLTPVLGLPLLALAIMQVARAGVQRVVVVTGYAAEAVEAALPGFAQSAGIRVDAVRVADHTLPNGHSVIAGAVAISGDYLLVMADHIFSDSILPKLAEQAAPDRGVTLAIDRRVKHPLIDPDDATWVRLGLGDRIAAIGKTIEPYDAVDCGAFLATSELADAIAEAITLGRPGSLSDGMQVLAGRGRAATMDIGDAWWIDVDDPRSLDLAEASVREHVSQAFSLSRRAGASEDKSEDEGAEA